MMYVKKYKGYKDYYLLDNEDEQLIMVKFPEMVRPTEVADYLGNTTFVYIPKGQLVTTKNNTGCGPGYAMINTGDDKDINVYSIFVSTILGMKAKLLNKERLEAEKVK